MRVRGLVWLGVATERYDDTVRFFRDVLGLRVEFEHERTVEFSAERDDRVQVFAPGHPYFDVFRAHTSAPVALFEVDDLDAARAELDAAGIELVGEPEQDSAWRWFSYRGPDGNLYSLAERIGVS